MGSIEEDAGKEVRLRERGVGYGSGITCSLQNAFGFARQCGGWVQGTMKFGRKGCPLASVCGCLEWQWQSPSYLMRKSRSHMFGIDMS